jgi:glutaminyl-tRNA synthetase
MVSGWDDPRMPTISGLRKRGYTPQSLKNFALTVGVSKRENIIDASLLEFCVRSHLNEVAPRAMAVINPLKIKIINYDKDEGEKINFEINPQKKEAGKRQIPFTDEMFIEKEDFQEIPEEGFFRLSPGEEVRLKNAYIIKAVDVVKDQEGMISEVLCEYDQKSKSGSNTPESNRKVKGTIHWVSAKEAVSAKINIYDRLFKVEEPGKNSTIENEINENSLTTKEALVEPYLLEAKEGQQFQFQRLGYFVKTDNKKTLEFNKTVGLRDGWKK